MKKYPKLKIVNSHLDYDNVTLIEASPNYYLHVALEVDKFSVPFFLFESSTKKKVLKRCEQFCIEVLKNKQVLEANVFKAILIPPGRGKYISESDEKIHIARFDVAILIEVDSQDALSNLMDSPFFKETIKYLEDNSSHIHKITATNAKRIGEVNHLKQGVFLFNYFYADDTQQNLEVWNYTAGWFEKETQLDNSVLMLPINKDDSDYNVINHCRWDKLTDILPSLIFKKTFKPYVLDNFYANNVGAMPILYKLIT